MSHALVEILPSEWNILLQLYAERKTDSSGYNVINNYNKWIAKEPEFNVKCYSLDGDWKKDGTFFNDCNVIFDDKYKFAYFNTLNDNLERLTQMLLCLAEIATDYKLHDYAQRLLPAVEAYKRSVIGVELPITQASWYHVSREIVASFSTDPPAGISVRSLSADDVHTVNRMWRYGSERTVGFIKRLIDYNVSVGAFDSVGQLVACCIRVPVGAVGVLHVVDSHRRLGLGSLMVRCLAKKIYELGDEVLAPIVEENIASKSMFEKLGFQKIDTIYWTG